MQPRRSLYIYKDLSLDHNLNQVSVVCTLIPCVTVMLIQVVSSLACSSHFPMHIQYVTILIHLDFIAFIIYDKGTNFENPYYPQVTSSLCPYTLLSACFQTRSIRILHLE